MLNLEKLKKITPCSIFDSWTFENSPEGIYISEDEKDIGRKISRVAVRGAIHDRAIYMAWEDRGMNNVSIANLGDKLYDIEHVSKLVKCTKEALTFYRK